MKVGSEYVVRPNFGAVLVLQANSLQISAKSSVLQSWLKFV